ncbi:MAG: type I restriction-modification system subunit M [Candidatus Pacearchaeota archaeon]
MLHNELKSKINKLWDKFWSGGLSNPITAIEQMSYLLFMKKLEDEDNKKQQEAEFTGERYDSIFKGHETCKWKVWTTYSADMILDHVRDKVFPFMRSLGNEDYSQYMKGANFGIPTAHLLIEAVNIINDMQIKEQNQDTQGDLYEYLLSELQTAGKNGQFRTPSHIIKMMVALADPGIDDKILDPACGTAGFLVNAYKYILESNKKNGVSTLTPKDKKKLDEESIFGLDIDETMVRISLMNLMMHGIKKPNIKRSNALSDSQPRPTDKTYNVVLANPPFKGSLNVAEISDRFSIKTSKTELLFLELMYHVLAPSGRCAVIVPEGVLFGNSKAHKQIRQKLLTECRLDSVISMPSGVFKPYAGVSTAVLFFTKGESTKKVWFYKMESDGFTLDDKRTFIDGKGDIPEIIDFVRNGDNEENNRKNKHFFVPIEEIKEKDWDLSISKYREIEYEEVKYEHPDKIVEKIELLEQKISEGLKELKKKI